MSLGRDVSSDDVSQEWSEDYECESMHQDRDILGRSKTRVFIPKLNINLKPEDIQRDGMDCPSETKTTLACQVAKVAHTPQIMVHEHEHGMGSQSAASLSKLPFPKANRVKQGETVLGSNSVKQG